MISTLSYSVSVFFYLCYGVLCFAILWTNMTLNNVISMLWQMNFRRMRTNQQIKERRKKITRKHNLYGDRITNGYGSIKFHMNIYGWGFFLLFCLFFVVPKFSIFRIHISTYICVFIVVYLLNAHTNGVHSCCEKVMCLRRLSSYECSTLNGIRNELAKVYENNRVELNPQHWHNHNGNRLK